MVLYGRNVQVSHIYRVALNRGFTVMHLSMCRPIPPPPGGVGLIWGKDSVFKSPSQQRIFEPQAVAHIKTGYKRVFTTQSQVQIPQYGAYISDQIRSNSPVCPGGRVVGQHIDRCIMYM